MRLAAHKKSRGDQTREILEHAEAGQLDQLRSEISELDVTIRSCIALRLQRGREIGKVKAGVGLAAHLPDRVKLVTELWMADARDRQVDPKVMRQIYQIIVAEGERLQTEEIDAAA